MVDVYRLNPRDIPTYSFFGETAHYLQDSSSYFAFVGAGSFLSNREEGNSFSAA